MRAVLLVLFLSFSLSGCVGTYFTFDQARLVTPGMTADQLLQIMGKPYAVTTRGQEQIWFWSHANLLLGDNRTVTFKVADGRVIEVPSIPDHLH